MNDVEVRACYLEPKDLDLNPFLILLDFHYDQALNISEYQFLYPHLPFLSNVFCILKLGKYN